jgi:anti-anti-sigma factor
MNMTILQRGDGLTHVVLAGRLDTTGAEEINERFSEATAARKQPAIVDLSDVEFMASRGIGLLITSGKRLAKAGHKMVLLNPKGLVESVLRTSRVDKALPLVYDLGEAIRILGGVPDESVAAGPRLETAAGDARPQGVTPVAAAPAAIPGELRLAIKNELAELKGLYETLARFLDAHHVPPKAEYAVNLAIDELVTNVMRYAYVDYDTHLIDIGVVIAGDQIVLRIVDDGRPFDPRTGPALDVHAEEREAGGLGLLLVLDMVDALNYRRVEEKNCVEVRVRLIAEAESEARPEESGTSDEAGDA